MKKPVRISLFLAVASMVLSGCLTSKNLPPDSARDTSQKILGDYYVEDDDGVRSDFRIEKSRDRDFDYRTVGDDEKGMNFNVYKMGDLHLLFAELDGSDETPYAAFRAAFSKTQIVLTPIDKEFFGENPSALPGTTVKRGSSGSVNSVSTTASPEALELFFRLHSDQAREIFDREVKLLYNRIGY